jgi:hypothetical protein
MENLSKQVYIGFTWIPMDSYGFLWNSYGFLWIPMDSYGIPMDSYGL